MFRDGLKSIMLKDSIADKSWLYYSIYFQEI